VILLLALVALGTYVILLDNQLRGGALQTALQPYIDKKDPDSAVVALAILQNYRETRSIAALWSGIYWGFTWTSAVLGGLAGLILKLESIISNEKVKKDVAAFLTLTAALMITISTGGDFQRKWQANRTASSEIERTGYEFLEHNGENSRGYLAEIGNSLQKRHLAIFGSSDKRKSSPEVSRLPSATK